MAHHTAGTMMSPITAIQFVTGPWQVHRAAFLVVSQPVSTGDPTLVFATAGLAGSLGVTRESGARILLPRWINLRLRRGRYTTVDERQFSFALGFGPDSRKAMDWQLEILSAPDQFAFRQPVSLWQFNGGACTSISPSRIAAAGLFGSSRAVNAVRRPLQWFRTFRRFDESNVAALGPTTRWRTSCRIIRDANDAWRIAPIGSAFHHSYAHPRKPGLQRDHRNR